MLDFSQACGILKQIVDIDDPIKRANQLDTSGLGAINLNQDPMYDYYRNDANLIRVDYAQEILLGFSIAHYERLLEIKSNIKNYVATGAELRKTLELYKTGTPISELETKSVSASIMILTNFFLQQQMSKSTEFSELINTVFKLDITTRPLMYPLDNIYLLINSIALNQLDSHEQAYLVANMSRAIIASMAYPEYKHDKLGVLCDQITLILPEKVDWWEAVKNQISTLRDIINIDLLHPEHVLTLTSTVSTTASTYKLPDLNI